LTSIVVTF
jgi:hypothetical protein